MQNLRVALAVLGLLCVSSLSAQSKRGPSTPAERTKALAAIDDLEQNPLGPNAQEERRWLTLWLIEVPDIHVSVCTLLPDLSKGDKKDSNIIFTQMIFSAGRYAIQHLNSPVNEVAQYQAGVEGSLHVYQVLLAQNPKDRQPKLDELVQKKVDGTLRAYVTEKASTGCKK
jgi:hypothetical protein